MAAAAINLDVGATGGGGPNAQYQLAVGRLRHRQIPDLDVFRSQQDRAAHMFG
jgi:hypothetical protein